MGLGLALACLLIAFVSVSIAGEKKPIKPSSKDKCPVCGMFVSKYPDWTAQIIFADGTYAVFDGVKDMMKYYLNMKRYNPAKDIKDIEAIYVKDYYSLKDIDGKKAFYVIGSSIYGPMGKEFIPFEAEDDAKVFLKDHKGDRIIKFKDIASVMQE
ncbi:nitrous oxide reductase accessory protein NosL [Dissulfurispira thermophila]|uniref:Nitrous oxide reductase accessory protein NosL n=2 Tax=root TaxID=1 RepID=A0A7G1H5M5_9BACT|nr:nitrous oxide reductase accessory protein NosL [Dissulfurispira thermophila]BCB97037.1 nitrous oxide reductase accessory protein NosL [Dissulfurispira thermophila]